MRLAGYAGVGAGSDAGERPNQPASALAEDGGTEGHEPALFGEDLLAVPHGEGKILSLLKILLGADSGISGEGTTSPPAGKVVLSFFGHPLTLRAVGKTTYFYLRALASKDHGRPWVKLGPGGLAELFTVNGKPVKAPQAIEPKVGEPALAEPPFEGLRKALAGAKEVRELGAGTLYGQPVTSFLAVLEPEQLKREHLGSAARLGLPAPPPATATLEVSLTQNACRCAR